jgi:DNA primase
MILTRGLACKVIILPEGEDVDSLLQAKGAGAFENLVDEAPEGLDYCLRTVRDTFAPKEVMDWATKFLRDLAREDMAAFFIPRIAAGLGLSERELRSGPRPATPPGRRASAEQQGPSRDECPDCYRLGFFIRNHGFIGECAGRDVCRILEHDWAKLLWNKLKDAGESGPPHDLTEPEKRFWIECRLAECESPEKQQEIWQGILEELEQAGSKDRKQEILQALRKAQDEKNEVEIERLNLEWAKEISREAR